MKSIGPVYFDNDVSTWRNRSPESIPVLDEETRTWLEERYPGILEMIRKREEAVLPPCPRCGSGDTAQVMVGIVGYSTHISAFCRKVKLRANGRPADFFCNACDAYFDPVPV